MSKNSELWKCIVLNIDKRVEQPELPYTAQEVEISSITLDWHQFGIIW